MGDIFDSSRVVTSDQEDVLDEHVPNDEHVLNDEAPDDEDVLDKEDVVVRDDKDMPVPSSCVRNVGRGMGKGSESETDEFSER